MPITFEELGFRDLTPEQESFGRQIALAVYMRFTAQHKKDLQEQHISSYLQGQQDGMKRERVMQYGYDPLERRL